LPQTKIGDMPIVVDVDEIDTPYYGLTTTHVEEEKKIAQEVEQPKEEVETIESDASRGKGMHQQE
jgi:hypothetical protein